MNSGYARCAVAQSLQLSLPQKLAIDGDWLMMRSGRAHWGVMMRRYGMTAGALSDRCCGCHLVLLAATRGGAPSGDLEWPQYS